MGRVYERAWEQGQDEDPYSGSLRYQQRPAAPPQPTGTYTLLGTMAGVFVLQVIVLNINQALHQFIFVIATDWYVRPWSLITSTLSHGGPAHILMNGLFLYFFGPTVETVVGRTRYFVFFFATGALSGVVQVHLSAFISPPGAGALGASGAIMGILGVLLFLTPKAQVMLLFPPIPLPLWVMGLIFIFLDVVGAFNPADRIGNFAHLSGLAVGLLYGMKVKQDLRARGLRLRTG